MLGKWLNIGKQDALTRLLNLGEDQHHEKLALVQGIAKERETYAAEEMATFREALVSIVNSAQGDIALTEHPARLRLVTYCITLIDDAADLLPLLECQALRQAAAARLCACLPFNVDHPANRHPLVIDARFERASEADIPELMQLATGAVQLSQLYLRANEDQQAALLAHPLLRREEGLATLEKCSRGHDKTTNRLARQRLEDVRGLKKELVSAMDALEQLDATLRKSLLSEPRDIEALIIHRKKRSQQQAKRDKLVASVDTCQAQLGERVALDSIFEPGPSPLSDADLSIPSASDDPFPRILDELDRLLHDLSDSVPSDLAWLDAASQRLSALHAAWSAGLRDYDPKADLFEKFEQRTNRAGGLGAAWKRYLAVDWHNLDPTPFTAAEHGNADRQRSQLEGWLRKAKDTHQDLAWPASEAAPEALLQLLSHIKTVENKIQLLQNNAGEAGAELKALTAAIRQQIDQGEFKKALGNLAKARRAQRRGGRGFDNKIAALSTELGELTDWQQFATSPKRESLIEAVSELATTPLDAEEQRDRLRALRSSWQQLGPVARSEAHLQIRFDEQAERAFEVCKTFFAEQDAERQKNLEQRKNLCQQLKTYLEETDWTQTDMQAAERIMREARGEWRRYHPCDRKALKPVEKTFEQLLDALYQHVRAGWEKNIDAKAQLVSAAEALAALEDVGDQVTQAKRLQAQWKTIGTTPRGPDQRLWKKFRQACDGVFERLGASRDAEAAEVKQRETTFSDALANFSPNVTDSNQYRRDLVELETLGSQVRLTTAQRGTLKAYREQLSDHLAAIAQHKKVAKLQQWAEWDRLVSQAEQDGTPIEPPHGIFSQRTDDASLDALRRLVIEAEIASDLASPEADQDFRMRLQVDLMNAGQRNMQLVSNDDLIQRWCRRGPKHAEADPLRDRFFYALEQRLD